MSTPKWAARRGLHNQKGGTWSRLHNQKGGTWIWVLFLTRRIAGPDEAAALAAEVEGWVESELGPGYRWPGNVRELEQCVRNVLLRREYRPAAGGSRGGGEPDPARELAEAVAEGSIPLDELERRYAVLVHARAGSYSAAGRRLGIDRRTVKRLIEG